MENKINYDLLCRNILKELQASGKKPSLLLHVCCAPCSSTVLEQLSKFFDITVYFYNPNIDAPEEYAFRAEESKRLVSEMPFENAVSFVEGEYETDKFLDAARGLEAAPEGGARCVKCFELRLERSARYAAEHGFDYFTTSLTVGPMKNSQILNSIGKKMSEKYGIPYLFSDFKKRGGYLRSIELSKEYDLYRQNYCGCSFSRKTSENDKALPHRG